MDKKSTIIAYAIKNGLPREKLQKCSGLTPRTFERRMANPDTFTIGELRQLDRLAHFPDAELIKLIRERNV